MECQEDLNLSPMLSKENFSISNLFDENKSKAYEDNKEVDQGPEESDFLLNYFDKDYRRIDLWATLRLLGRINKPEDIFEDSAENIEYNNDYLEESNPEKIPYILRVLDQNLDDDNFDDLDNELLKKKEDTKEDDEDDLFDLFPREELSEEEIEERELEEKIAT
ncbi:hypothetical protein KY342_02015 [Candidatus Woesearchaeota archaeon]|nr:hypothetical protein [Candidatus Woesearchaeota archaeon]